MASILSEIDVPVIKPVPKSTINHNPAIGAPQPVNAIPVITAFSAFDALISELYRISPAITRPPATPSLVPKPLAAL